ncbi:MAG TPA: cyclophilin-like fold protein [Candidatus Bathyarchaeia archaeon]|nr:cyclophilin-like fold protein [Candidatus Bathyarchaeia archaeon]
MSSDIARTKVKFVIEGRGEAEGEFISFLSPRTADALIRKMPIEGRAAIWKEEVYFETPAKLGSEKPRGKVEVGDIAYWPMGSAICIFYGPSQPYSPVNILGRVTNGLELFRFVKSGTKITVTKIIV